MKSKFLSTARAVFFGALISVPTVIVISGCAETATRESTGEYVDDSTITTKVKAAFVADKEVSVFDIKVDTYKGIVQLSGFVDTQAEKSRAEQLAGDVKGVKSVENRLSVKS